MPKSLIVYFSQGGSTARVAQAIAAGLSSAGHKVTLCNMKDQPPPQLQGYDLFGIGSPTYYYRLPFNVASYVDSLRAVAGLPAFAFVLHGTYRGDAGNALCWAAVRHGARLVGYFHCYGPDMAYGYLRQGYLFSPDHPTAEELDRAERFGREVAGRAASQVAIDLPDDPPVGAIYRLERFLTGEWLTRNVYSRLFRVNKSTCSKCGVCVQQCPVGNISMDPDKWPVWGRKCIVCLYCEMTCPQHAIISPASWPAFLPFFKYNVWAASRDPTLDHVRVTIDHGRVTKLG